MKKKTLCAFALIVWFLLFSTFFSLWVEQTMTPWVSATQGRASQDSMKEHLPLDCLTRDEDGVPVLYQTFEGTGWEEGVRVTLFDPQNYQVTPEKIELEFGTAAPVVRYSSKPLHLGELIHIIETPQSRADALLVICPEGVPPLKEDAPETYRVVEQTDTALLVACEEASVPFLPKEADSALFETDPFLNENRQAYSLTELQEFTGSLRLLALVCGLVLMTLILWAFSCFLVKDAKRNRKLLIVNGGIALAALAAIPFLLHGTKLPSSLLPRTVIVDFGHYSGELSQIFDALKGFGGEGGQVARQAADRAGQMLFLSLGIALAGIAAGVMIILLEKAALRAKRKPKGRHAAK